MIAILSTWTKYVFTIRVCRSKQQQIPPVIAAPLTPIHLARFCSQHSGIIPQKAPHHRFCILFFFKPLTMSLCFYRRKLSELDNIQRYFSRKLSTPTFPPMSEQDCHTRHEEQEDTDSCQLLLKSNQLVGEVNNIITGEGISIV